MVAWGPRPGVDLGSAFPTAREVRAQESKPMDFSISSLPQENSSLRTFSACFSAEFYSSFSCYPFQLLILKLT